MNDLISTSPSAIQSLIDRLNMTPDRDHNYTKADNYAKQEKKEKLSMKFFI